MTIDSTAIIKYVASTTAASGYFSYVNEHEPKGAPVLNGITAAVWVETLGRAVGQSGMSSTTALLTLKMRLYTSFMAEPQDMIDPRVVSAVDAMMLAFSADFTLGGLVEPGIDLLGRASDGLNAEAGYIDQDRKLFRIMDITIPLIINDAWEQSP